MATDWFRKTAWTSVDVLDFETRLKRARSRSRPQYLYIQAHTFWVTGQTELVREALVLADRSLVAMPPYFHASAARLLKGKCFERLGQTNEALDEFIGAVDAERTHRGLLTDAYLDFAWLVAVVPLPQRYERALVLLDEFADRRVFPVQRFRGQAARALIAAACGNANAAEYARSALDAAGTTRSGFSHHQELGLVENRYEAVRTRLQALAVAG